MFTIFQCFPVSTFSKLTPCLIIWDYRNPKFVEPWWNFHKKKNTLKLGSWFSMKITWNLLRITILGVGGRCKVQFKSQKLLLNGLWALKLLKTLIPTPSTGVGKNQMKWVLQKHWGKVWTALSPFSISYLRILTVKLARLEKCQLLLWGFCP